MSLITRLAARVKHPASIIAWKIERRVALGSRKKMIKRCAGTRIGIWQSVFQSIPSRTTKMTRNDRQKIKTLSISIGLRDDDIARPALLPGWSAERQTPWFLASGRLACSSRHRVSARHGGDRAGTKTGLILHDWPTRGKSRDAKN